MFPDCKLDAEHPDNVKLFIEAANTRKLKLEKIKRKLKVVENKFESAMKKIKIS